jgi:hypothetical protein
MNSPKNVIGTIENKFNLLFLFYFKYLPLTFICKVRDNGRPS